jgi:phage terminase large subunit
VSNFWEFLSNPVSKMNFLGGGRGSERLISQNTLLKIVSKKYGLMLRAVENNSKSAVLSNFLKKILEF